MITQQIQQDYLTALKQKDQKKVDVLRFLSSDIKNKQIAIQKELTDGDVVEVIRKQVKQLNEAAQLFDKGGRADLAAANKEQVTILSTYLPPEISDEVLKTNILQIIAENKELHEKNPKAIIGILMGKLTSEASPARIMAVFNSL